MSHRSKEHREGMRIHHSLALVKFEARRESGQVIPATPPGHAQYTWFEPDPKTEKVAKFTRAVPLPAPGFTMRRGGAR
jgi:hypothetical protein